MEALFSPPDLELGFNLRPKQKNQNSSRTLSATPARTAMEHPKSATPRAHNEPDTFFRPYNVLDDTAKAGLVGGASGLFIASIRNALSKTNVGALSVFTRGAPIIGLASMHIPS